MNRRRFVSAAAAHTIIAASAALHPLAWAQLAQAPLNRRAVPASGEQLAVVGMGSWLTFDVSSERLRAPLKTVLQHFFAHGGALLDSSPMYGAAEETLGMLLPGVPRPQPAFAASKVWTIGRDAGITQMEKSRRYWGVSRFDLMQIHNMLDWKTHLETLKTWKGEGRLRYIGITTSHGRRHDDLEAAMKRERFDFVQFSYSLADRSVERRLLPLAAQRGAAVLINRPFDGGNLFGVVGNKPLPAVAKEIGCATWAEFLLKFVVSHPAVTCAIPATSQPLHMLQNMRANVGTLPDAATRAQMAKAFDAIA